MVYRLLIVVILCILPACDILSENPLPDATPVSVRVNAIATNTPQVELTDEVNATPVQPTATIPPTATPMPFNLESAISVMSGICFESVADAAGQVFVMRNAEEHINLYDLAENSELCRRPIIRNPFDFSNGRILAGTWTYGIGCTADHEILNVVRDDDGQSIRVDLRFQTFGECPYELVRPFWVAFEDAQDYDVTINVEQNPTSN